MILGVKRIGLVRIMRTIILNLEVLYLHNGLHLVRGAVVIGLVGVDGDGLLLGRLLLLWFIVILL